MKLLKFFTSRNAFSREYGTWLIVLFNSALVPILLQELNITIIYFWLSIFFFLMFRFELLDIISIELQYSKKSKIIRASIYLILSATLFSLMVLKNLIDINTAILICISGICMLLLNLITRRKKGKRQNIFAQIAIVCFIALLGAMNYFILVGRFDNIFFTIFISSALFYSNSIIYVRSKTYGSPFDIYALLFSVISILIIILLNFWGITRLELIVVFIPSLVKTLDNVILTNTKVPLRRVGINETIHCIIFIWLLFLFYE